MPTRRPWRGAGPALAAVITGLLLSGVLPASSARADDEATELAKKTQNPVAGVAVVPIRGADGQELEPRSYVNTPVGLNFVLAGYGYTKGSVVFSGSASIKDAEVHTHCWRMSSIVRPGAMN